MATNRKLHVCFSIAALKAGACCLARGMRNEDGVREFAGFAVRGALPQDFGVSGQRIGVHVHRTMRKECRGEESQRMQRRVGVVRAMHELPTSLARTRL